MWRAFTLFWLTSCGPGAPLDCAVPAMDTLYQDGPPDPSIAPPAADACVRAKHDAIIVLGCPNNDDGTPSDCQRARAAIAISFAGYADHFITSGAAVHNAYVEADTLAQLLIAGGVSAAAVITETQAQHTDENIANSSTIMRERKWRSALIVSDEPGQFFYEALCDSNCCVEEGRLTLFTFPTASGAAAAGHYVLRPSGTASTAHECATLTNNGQCLLLASRTACVGE
jgi:hypothetical protein